MHVLNLQQTAFLVPHWFTESLAVRNELGGYPADWDRILAKHVAEEKLFDLASISHGFIRPGNSKRWTLAYFQAYLSLCGLYCENSWRRRVGRDANGLRPR